MMMPLGSFFAQPKLFGDDLEDLQGLFFRMNIENEDTFSMPVPTFHLGIATPKPKIKAKTKPVPTNKKPLQLGTKQKAPSQLKAKAKRHRCD
jgi:hypothetical protein